MLPKLVRAVAWACPLEPLAVDTAAAVLPFIVVADEVAFAEPTVPLDGDGEIPPLPPVAVEVALAVPPSIAVEIAATLAAPPLPGT